MAEQAGPVYIGPDQNPRERWDAWREIERRLQAPFPVSDIQFRVQGKPKEAPGKSQVVAYVTARAIQRRLDTTVGAENWTFTYTPLGAKAITATLVIHGVAKSDVGDATTIEPEKGMVSDGEKRAGVQWGIGRYLYANPASSAWVVLDDYAKVPSARLEELRRALAGPAPVASQEAKRGQSATRQASQPADQPHAAPAGPPADLVRDAQQVADDMGGMDIVFDVEDNRASALEVPWPAGVEKMDLAALRKWASVLGYDAKKWGAMFNEEKGQLARIATRLKSRADGLKAQAAKGASA